MITGPKNTLSAGIARKVVKRAQQKALAKDTATVLAGIRKAAMGVGCPGAKIRSGSRGRGLGRGAGKGPLGVPIGTKVIPEDEKGKKVLAKSASANILRAIIPLLGRLGGGAGGLARRGLGAAGSAAGKVGLKGVSGALGTAAKAMPTSVSAGSRGAGLGALLAGGGLATYGTALGRRTAPSPAEPKSKPKPPERADKSKQVTAKSAAVAMVALKHGNTLQKRAAIGDMLAKILPLLTRAGKGVAGGAGKALGGAKHGAGGVMQSLQSAMAQPLTTGTLAIGAGAMGGGHLLSKALGKERISAMRQGAGKGLLGGIGSLPGMALGLSKKPDA